MECYYHPEREATDQCAICGKVICKECGIEIAGKIYCKDCLEKIVGVNDANTPQQDNPVEVEEPITTEPTISEVIDETIYQPQEGADDYEIPYVAQDENSNGQAISDDSPYNIRENIEYTGGLETPTMEDPNNVYQAQPLEQDPQVAQNEFDSPDEPVLKTPPSDDFIYPDHSYEPQPTSARQDLEDKYEKYLDDLYFEENETPLDEQLARDEAQYGSLTRRQYEPRQKAPVEQQPPVGQQAPAQKKVPVNETPEEMEARIRAEILQEQNQGNDKGNDKNIHNLNYQEEKEPMGVVDILLTVILIIIILIVIYYLVYLFMLNSIYPTFMDAIFALKNPQNVINHILSH